MRYNSIKIMHDMEISHINIKKLGRLDPNIEMLTISRILRDMIRERYFDCRLKLIVEKFVLC